MPQRDEIGADRLGRMVEDAASEVYLFSAESFQFVLVNRGARENLGYTRAEISGLTPWDLKPDIPREQFLKLIRPLLSKECERLDFETRHRRKDGTHYDVAVRLQLIDSDGTGLFYAAIQDITSQKFTERSLVEVSSRLDAILGNTTMAIFMMDASQQCVFMNSAAEELTGYTLAETQGRPLHDVIHHTYPDGRPFPIHECAIDRAFPENNRTTGEEIFVHKDGSFYPVGFTASPMKNSDWKTVGTIIEVRNIAAEIEARQAMEAFNKTLKARVDEAIAERQALETQLVQAQKMEAIGQLSGGIAHDFNNLLQVIAGNLQMLNREIVEGDPRRQRIVNALSGVTRGAELAKQLLAFGRQQTLEPRPINIGKLVRGMDDMLRRTLSDAIEVETVMSGGLWNCMADPAQVENVLLNLAINARDAMDGRGKLTIEAGNAVLDETYAISHPEVSPGRYVMLAVTDNGAGIPAEIRDKVFEPFFTTKGPGQGTGLGLSMVYGFVKQSGGHIKIYSEPGEGTTIRIYLPRTLGEERTPDGIAEPGVPAGGSETILVVEDDDDVRATSVALLRDLGYRVFEATNADNALVILQSGLNIDLLFTDVVMPGKLRSPDLAQQARQRLPHLKVLFTSGYTQNAIVHAGRLDDGVELIAKPFTIEALATKIRRILGTTSASPHGSGSPAETGCTEAPTLQKQDIAGLEILVVEDEVLIRMTLAETLESMGHKVHEADSIGEAREHLEHRKFDVLITDLGLPDGSAVDLVLEYQNLHPAMAIVIATGSEASQAFPDADASLFRTLRKPYNEEEIKSALAPSDKNVRLVPPRSGD